MSRVLCFKLLGIGWADITPSKLAKGWQMRNSWKGQGGQTTQNGNMAIMFLHGLYANMNNMANMNSMVAEQHGNHDLAFVSCVVGG